MGRGTSGWNRRKGMSKTNIIPSAYKSYHKKAGHSSRRGLLHAAVYASLVCPPQDSPNKNIHFNPTAVLFI